jgi:hypothetical protein
MDTPLASIRNLYTQSGCAKRIGGMVTLKYKRTYQWGRPLFASAISPYPSPLSQVVCGLCSSFPYILSLERTCCSTSVGRWAGIADHAPKRGVTICVSTSLPKYSMGWSDWFVLDWTAGQDIHARPSSSLRYNTSHWLNGSECSLRGRHVHIIFLQRSTIGTQMHEMKIPPKINVINT